MTVRSISNHEYRCDYTNCDFTQVSSSGRPHDWGLVCLYDQRWKQHEIGDQNGWNNFDMCPEHYEQFMKNLGIDWSEYTSVSR